MKKLIAVAGVLALLGTPAFAQTEQKDDAATEQADGAAEEPITAEDVDAAVVTITEFAGDEKKVAGYCEIAKQLEALKEDDEKGAEELGGKMDAYLAGLGEDVEEAFGTADEVTADSEEEKKINAALEALDEKCGG